MLPHAPLDSTLDLLQRIRVGDTAARESLVARYLPILRRWAHGRLPRGSGGLADTDDVVQVTLMRALNHLEDFEYRHDGAFLAYLRQGVLNAIRQEIRRSRRHPVTGEVPASFADPAASVVEEVIGREVLRQYEDALLELTDDQRDAALLRVEFGLSYREIASLMGKPSANAARMLVVRALVALSERLGRE